MFFNFNSDFKSQQIKYAVFIGRFQPFLRRTHFEYCLNGILGCGLKPILVFGSSNEITADGVSKKFNPLNNPLNNHQRLQQLQFLNENIHEDVLFGGFLNDKFDNDIWFKSVLDHLDQFFAELDNGDSIKNTVFFRVQKGADLNKDSRINPPSLSYFDNMISKSTFGGILNPGSDDKLSNISATHFRKINVSSSHFKNNVIAADYIKNLIRNVRQESEWGEYFNKLNLDLTMLDLALYRFCNEAKLNNDIILNSSIRSVDDLEVFLTKLLIK